MSTDDNNTTTTATTQAVTSSSSSSTAPATPKKPLTKEQKEDLKVSFDLFDRDGSGKINYDELKQVMLRFGHRLSEVELHELINSVDVNHDGEIDFQEFCTLMEIKGVTYDPDAELKLAFHTIDTDGSGTISVKELKELMDKTNQQVSDADFDALMSSIDTNGDGVLDFEEFKELMVCIYIYLYRCTHACTNIISVLEYSFSYLIHIFSDLINQFLSTVILNKSHYEIHMFGILWMFLFI